MNCEWLDCPNEAAFRDKYGNLYCARCAQDFGFYTCGLRPIEEALDGKLEMGDGKKGLRAEEHNAFPKGRWS